VHCESNGMHCWDGLVVVIEAPAARRPRIQQSHSLRVCACVCMCMWIDAAQQQLWVHSRRQSTVWCRPLTRTHARAHVRIHTAHTRSAELAMQLRTCAMCLSEGSVVHLHVDAHHNHTKNPSKADKSLSSSLLATLDALLAALEALLAALEAVLPSLTTLPAPCVPSR